MDFFGHQDAARRASRRLTVLFAFAVIAVAVGVAIAVGVALGTANPAALAAIAALAGGVILIGSFVKSMQLSAGGSAVAELLDGRRITNSTTDPDEKRLQNVVEEMALAAGVPVPLVYVMDHEGAINAFAAGHSPNDAAIAVTHGLMRSMNRDELQGVIAHEFSHILNGDMRLNVRMIGLLFGIEMIGHAGRVILDGSSRSRSRDSGGAGWLGLALLVIGFGGVFLSNMIRSAIGRQREYLADASAVQFTRNPEGIGNALVKIAAASGLVEHRSADSVSHMFIATALEGGMAGLFATHPPIEERIERVLGKGARARIEESARKAARAESREPRGERLPRGERIGTSGGIAFGRAVDPIALATGVVAAAGAAELAGAGGVERVVKTIGNPGREHVDYAHALLRALPEEVRKALETPAGATALLVALLVPEAASGTDLRAALAGRADAQTIDTARWLAPALERLEGHLKLPVAALAFPVIRALPESERGRIVALVRALIAADAKVTPFEFALSAMLARQIDAIARRPASARTVALTQVSEPASMVLSLFVRAASQGSLVFDRMAKALGLAGATLAAPSAVTLPAVERSLGQLAALAPADKERLIRACLEAVLADGQVSVREAELMRAVCASLDAPLPPIVDAAALAELEAASSEAGR